MTAAIFVIRRNMIADFHYVACNKQMRITFYETSPENEGARAGSIMLSREKFRALWEMFNCDEHTS